MKDSSEKNQKQSFARRDRLIEIQNEAQKMWQDLKIHNREIDENKPKYMITFPYPYMNGRLHLGHAFSLTKAEFMARYKSLKGYNVLFPFGFHCTGMPICAAAKKLERELKDYSQQELLSLEGQRAPFKKEISKLLLKIHNKKKLTDQEKKTKKEMEKELQKIPAMTQFEILKSCEVKIEEIQNFIDPLYWLSYFPPKAKTDLTKFGVAVDFRRSFITTSKNPYYDSFIRWQFEKLKEKNVIKFGKRPSIYSIESGQMCSDHDRSEGEGVNPQEYTLIKITITDQKSSKIFKTDEKIILVAATLRPETMYGQTNCFVLPEGQYGMFRMKNKEIWVCSEKSMKNMSYQYLTDEFGKFNKLGDVKGTDMIGLECSAPLTSYQKIYIWPMLNISMDKGTGIVTSVPSDAPDDYAVLMDLKKKKPLREKFGLSDEQVLPYEPISIINIPDYSELSAIKAYGDYKIKSMNDKAKLQEAKLEVYQKGFYSGIMKVGEFKDAKVQDAKNLVKSMMIKNNQACTYYEPENRCVSRLGDECVVALCDQWYINYGEETMRQILIDFVKSEKFFMFNDTLKSCFVEALEWLKDWGCSRSFGLGTSLPWDDQYLIESLSDSTIYMAYYTVAHLLQSDLEGKVVGKLDIEAKDITSKDWDYIFLDKERAKDSKIDEVKLKEMRNSFKYWYPLDLRCSGKDLIKNHLTMSLYNHYYVWGEKNLPQGIFCNGWIMIDGMKMSKSLGNFYTLSDICDKYSADASRIALANAGDLIVNANLELNEVDNGVLKLSNLENTVKEITENCNSFRSKKVKEVDFFDRIFANEIKNIILKADHFYEHLVMREVTKEVFFTMNHIREEYKSQCGNIGPRKELIMEWLEVQLILLFPIAPHFCDVMWKNYYLPSLSETERKMKPELVSFARFPRVDKSEIDFLILKQSDYLQKHGGALRSAYQKYKSKNKKKQIKKIYILIAENFKDWQVNVLNVLSKTVQNMSAEEIQKKKWIVSIKNLFQNDKKRLKKAMAFATFTIKEFKNIGNEVFETKSMFNEKYLQRTF